MPTRSSPVSVVVWALLAAACAPKAELELNRDHLDFGEVEVGGTYRLSVVLSNYGEAELKVNGVRLEPESPELELEGLPLAGLAPGGRQVLRVVYRPTAEGALSSTLHVDAADSKGARELPLTGRAVLLGAVVSLEPGASCSGMAGSLDFGTVTSGDAGVRLVTVESTGSGTISMLKATISPEDAGFTVEGLAAARSLAPGQSASFTVRYDPTRAGPQAGALTLETNSFLLPRIEIPICGTGMVSALCATPATLAFGTVAPGASATAQLTASSCGNLPVTLESASVVTGSPGFSLAPAPVVPQTLAPGQSTVLDVRFDATSTLTARSQLRLTSSSPVTPEVFVPAGANLPPPCNASLGPTTLRMYKDLASSQSVRLTNGGTTDCVIERLEIVPAGSDFALERVLAMPAVLAARSSMELTVKYAPPATATRPTSGTLQVELDWTHEVRLVGDPRPPSGCHLVPQSPVVDFGLINGAGLPNRDLVLTGVGTDPCKLHGVTFDKPGFSAFIPDTEIAPGSAGRIIVSYVTVAPLVATMTVSSSDDDQPQRAIPVITGHVRCDPNCACTAQQTATFWRFSGQVGSAVTPATSALGAYQESCDPKRCPEGQVAVEVDRGVLQCASAPPDCPAGFGIELKTQEWSCVPCAVIVQFGGLFAGQRACAPLPALSCASGTVPTFDAKELTWRCVSTCNNGAYDQRTLANGALVCVPC